jgi:threonine synthase
MAFKDIAARVLARLFEFYLKKEKKSITILVATSGDTGGAIAQAFSGVAQVKVVILYPSGKVSEFQEEQLTRVGENVISIAVNGDFDDCQGFVKRAFQDSDLKNLNLSSANSINIGRLIPQIIYYVWSYLLLGSDHTRVVVPSGNLGNATAALLAQRMGTPIESFVIATNENDVAVTYYATGMYKNKKTVRTLSTAMDIGSPNNFERILELFHYNHDEFRKKITAVKVSDPETIETIQKVNSQEKYLLDFHTAVGYNAAQKCGISNFSTVIVSTASPIKFAKEMQKETGILIDNKEVIRKLQEQPKHVIKSENTYEAIKNVLLSFS